LILKSTDLELQTIYTKRPSDYFDYEKLSQKEQKGLDETIFNFPDNTNQQKEEI